VTNPPDERDIHLDSPTYRHPAIEALKARDWKRLLRIKPVKR
jgi:hypothetical protein